MQPHEIPTGHALSLEQYVDDRTLADLLGLSRSYLRQLRVSGGGPRFTRLGAKAVRYRVADALDWAASKPAGTSTSELEAA
jgi:predicted DNA-binding transcriptional regulator AlpA